MKVSGLILSICLLILAEQVAADGHTETEVLGDLTFECTEGWGIYKGNCFKAIDVPMTYALASLTCLGQGGFLYYAENEIEYFDYVAELLDKTIWFDFVKKEGKWMIGDSEVPPEFIPGWGVYQPDLDNYDYTAVNPREKLMLTDGDNLFPFVCKRRACRQGYVPCDLATKCIPKKQLCNKLPECTDESDENNCPALGTSYERLTSDSGSFSTGTLEDFEEKTWSLEAPIGKRIRLDVPSMSLETNIAFVEVWGGGPTFESSELLNRFTGIVSPVSLYSTNNFLKVRMYAKDLSAFNVGPYTFGWRTNIPQIPDGEQVEVATDAWKSFSIPFTTDLFPPKYLMLWWRIEAMEGQRILYYVEITPKTGYSADDVKFMITAETWTDGLEYREYYISSTNVVHVRSDFVPEHGHVRLRYKQGCDLDTDVPYGRIMSPQPIPDAFVCTWTLSSGQDVSRGMSLRFSKLDLAEDPRQSPESESQDKLMVYPDQSDNALTGISENDLVHSPDGYFRINIETDAAFMSPGVEIRFGRDCEALKLSDETKMSTNMTYIYEDVDLTCPEGYKFHMEKYRDMETVTLKCFAEGWRIDGKDPGALPECQAVSCGPPTKIENGGVLSSTGVTYKGVATYFCNAGFMMNGGEDPRQPNATCDENGQWKDVPTCTSANCTALSQNMIPNGKLEIIRGNDFSGNDADYNIVVEFSCDEGYELLGSIISHCATSGWTHTSNPPSCAKIPCAVPRIPNSDVPLEGPSGKTLYQETYEVRCNTNYRFSNEVTGPISMLCRANGTFDQSPVCEDIDECDEGSDGCDDDSTTCVNIDGAYLCDCLTGFERDTSTRCKDIKECEDDNAGCSTRCVEEEGSYHCECDLGYKLFEEEGFNGFYNPQGETGFRRGDRYYINHTCVPVQCPELQPVTNGMYLTNSLSNFNYQDTVTLQCNDGFRVDKTGAVITSFESTCGNDGTWDEIYGCEARECILPSTPTKGEYDKTKVLFGETVTLTCNLTEVKKKELTAVCLYDNNDVRFAGYDIDQCPEIDCGNPDDAMPVGGNFFGGVRPSTTTYFGGASSFSFTCNAGFDETGASNDTDNNRLVRCKDNGRWDFGTLACTGKMCKDPGTPGDAQQVVNGYEIDSVLSYTCNRDGFTITGPESYTCVYNSGTNSVAWSDNLAANFPECQDTEDPTFSGDCEETIVLDTLEVVDFNPGLATDNFNTLAEFSVTDTIVDGITRLIADTEVTYTATDFEGNKATCTINFDVIDRSETPNLNCPPFKTIEVSKRDSEPYDTSSEITVTGGTLQATSPPSIPVTVGNIGNARIVTASATNQYGTESTCTFMVNFVADACFEEELFQDSRATRSCFEVGSTLECVSTCIGNNLYSDKASTKNFTCSGNGVWDYTNTDPNDRFCLQQLNPEYNVDVNIIHTFGGVTGGCDDNYLALLVGYVTSFQSQISNQCGGQQWEVSVLDAKARAFQLLEFEATLNLKLLSLSATQDQREECVDSLGTNVEVFNVNTALTCDQTSGSLTAGPVTTGQAAETCANKAYKLVDNVCLSYGPGQFYNENTSSAEDCPVGEYQDGLAQTNCKTCLDGQYPNSDQTACQVTCSSGFTSVSGFYPCTPCPVNEYWTSKSTCTACSGEGSTVGVEGAASTSQCYEPCPAGTYSRTGYDVDNIGNPDVNRCRDCPVNFYQDLTGQMSCKECSQNLITKETGQSDSDSCVLDDQDSEECNEAYCSDNGVCLFRHHRKACNCNPGYYGDKCQSMFNICDGNPCTNSGTCVKGDAPGEYTCTCRKDLDTCDMITYSEDRIGPNDPAPYTSRPVTSEEQCKQICLSDDDCLDASFVQASSTTQLCVLYNIELSDAQLSAENNDADKHFRKECKTAFGGAHCELDTDDNCDGAGCSENSECMDKINGFQCICPSSGGFTGTFCTVADDPCSPNPCVNGRCQAFGSVRYECTCLEGFEGLKCDKNIDECALQSFPCAYDGACNNLIDSFSCSCKQGFSDLYCRDTPDFCNSHDCSGNNICYNSLDRMEGVCVCDTDLFEPLYRCPMEEQQGESALEPNSNWADNPLNVQTIENCKILCQENPDCAIATFQEVSNQPICLQYNSSYQGKQDVDSVAIYKDCNNKPAEAYACSKVKEPCDGVDCNNGSCQNVNNGLSSSCRCETGFTGSHCQHSIDDCVINNCQNGAVCVDGHMTYTCSCAAGYEGTYCDVDIDDCPDCCNTTYGTCVDKVDGYECQCNPGYTGEDCDIEINECASSPCQHGGVCTEKVNGFECDCPDEWEGDRCEQRKNNCPGDQPCLNGGECFSLEKTTFCRCEGGTTGTNCQNAKLLCNTLSDFNVNPCVNEGVCVNTAGAARCSCPVVYDLERCYMEEGINDKSGGNPPERTIQSLSGTSLTEDNCKTNCLNNRLCASVTYLVSGNVKLCVYYTAAEEMLTDNPGTMHFRRNCPTDYSGVSCELVKDWCSTNPCKNGGKCMQLDPVGYDCQCEPGYSGPTCEVVAEPCDDNPCRSRATCQSTPTEHICQCEEGKVWTGSVCRTTRKDYTLFVDAAMGQNPAHLQTPFLLNADELSVIMNVRLHYVNEELPNAALFTLITSPDFEWTESPPYEFTLSVSRFGIYVIYGENNPIGIEFDDEFGYQLLDGEWHLVGISIDKTGMMSASIDALHLQDPVDTGRNFSLESNMQIFLGYGYKAEFQEVEVYDKYLDSSVFADASTGKRPQNISPVQGFYNYLLPPAAMMNLEAYSENLKSNPNMDIPSMGCDGADDVNYASNDRLTAISSIDDLINTYDDVVAASGEGLSFDHSVDSTLTWGYHPVIITGLDETTMNYGECRFNLYIRYNAACPAVISDSTVTTDLCPLNGQTNSVCDISCTIGSRRLAAATPSYIICGSLGVDDFRTPFVDVILPSCMTPQPALYRLKTSMEFTLQIGCTDVREDTISKWDSKIRDSFLNDIDERWNNDWCTDISCSNLKDVEYKCIVGTPRVSVSFSLEFESMTITAKGGGDVNIVDALKITLLIEVDELHEALATIAGAVLIDSSVEINQITVCPTGNRLDTTKDEPVCVPCSQGMYLDDGQCKPCDYGHYQDLTGQEECKQCEEETTTYQKHSKSSADCKEICKAGSYYDEDENTCKPCKRHFYQPEDGKNFCVPCRKEFKTVGEGSDSASDCEVDCPPGEYRTSENAPCEICKRGFWRSLEYDDCQACPANTTTFKGMHAESVEDCDIDLCPDGEYFSVDEDDCKPCALGRYQDEEYMLDCKDCPGNTTTRDTGSASEEQCEFYCPPGYRRDGSKEACLHCERGYYKDNDGDSKFEACKQCPTDTTDIEGATSRDDCSIPICTEGQTIDKDNECDDCDIDSFSDVELPTTKTECLPCDSLFESGLYGTLDPGSTSDECKRYCGRGTFLNGDSCDMCARGYYKDNAGNTRFNDCTKCPDDDGDEMTTDSMGAEDALLCNVYKCAAGSIHTSTGCQRCELNTYQPVDHPLSTIECLPCQPVDERVTNTRTTGTVNPEDCIQICDPGEYLEDNACKSCPRGTFKDNIGDNRFGNCIDCTGDKTTEDVGTKLASQCNIPKCPAGDYLEEGECTPCPQDEYSEVVNPNSEVQCQKCSTVNGVVYGTEDTGTANSSLCKPTCPGGKQFDSGDCVDCPIGTFKGDDIRFGDCISCETVKSGYVTSETGAKTSDQCDLRDCKAGEKIVGSTCELCPIGFYQDEPRKTTCKECGENRSTNGGGKTSPDDCQINCGPGFQGTVSCTKCPDGTVKPDEGYSNCEECPADYTSNEAHTVCDVVYCSIGKEYKEGEDPPCKPCELGFYKNEIGNDQQCTQCPLGTTTDGTGQASCDMLNCVPGKYKLDDKCDFCPVGTYKSSTGNQECTACSDKSTTGDVTGATSSSQCDTVLCDPGQYREPGQKLLCLKCEIGTYQDTAGKTSCTECPNNEITLDVGQKSVAACVPECKKGQQFNTTTEECTLCPTGTYKDIVGNLELCQLCETDTTTAGPGSTMESDCSENVCPPGKFYEVQNKKIVCIDCPKGTYSDRTMQEECTPCPNDDTTLAEGRNSDQFCIENCDAGEGYDTYGSVCRECKIGNYNPKQGGRPNTCKRCPFGRTNSQTGSTSCSFPVPGPVAEPRINFQCTCTYRVALDQCSDTISINLILDRILAILRFLFQLLTNLRYNGAGRFCRGQNCDNLRLSSTPPRCQQIPTQKRAISHSLDITVELGDISEYTTDPQDGNSNISTVELLSQIFTLYAHDLSNETLELIFMGFDDIVTTELCVRGKKLVNDVCSPCPEGQYGSESGVCTQCPVDYYQDDTGQIECKQCPDKTYTENKMGSTSDSDCIPICQAGNEFDNGTKTCSECAVGFYKEEAGNEEACTQCSADRTTKQKGSTSENDCSETVCLAGEYYYTDSVTGDIKCNPCDFGKYNPNKMVDTCEDCPSGKTTLFVGRKTLSECKDVCDAGYGFDTNRNQCLICEQGQYNDQASPDPNICKLCPPDKTNYQPGQTGCNIDVLKPVIKRFTIRVRLTFDVAINTCGDTDLNSIRTTISIRIRTVFRNSRDAKYDLPRSFCDDNCNNVFVVFPDDNALQSCRVKSSGRRKRALTHEIDLELQFKNTTEGTEDKQTGSVISTKEVINQVLANNKDQLSPVPGEIEYKSADPPVSEPVCSAGEQPVNDDCVMCTTGRYSASGESCVLCPKDTYQDEQGQSSCKDCPAQTFYEGTGATASSACGSWCANNPGYCNSRGVCTDTGRRTARCSCTENYEGATCDVKKEPQSDLPAILGGAIGGGAALLFIILIAVGLMYRCSRGSPEKRKAPYRDPEYVQNGAYEGTYDNFGYHDGQVRPIAPYPSVGYPALGYKPDTSFENGSYARPYKYRPSINADDRDQADDSRFVWTA